MKWIERKIADWYIDKIIIPEIIRVRDELLIARKFRMVLKRVEKANE